MQPDIKKLCLCYENIPWQQRPNPQDDQDAIHQAISAVATPAPAVACMALLVFEQAGCAREVVTHVSRVDRLKGGCCIEMPVCSHLSLTGGCFMSVVLSQHPAAHCALPADVFGHCVETTLAHP